MTDQVDQSGRSPLHYAALDGDLECVRALLVNGADPNALDRAGFRPLHFAAQEQRADVVPVLVGAGADPNTRDGYGNTPLWRAVFSSQGKEATTAALLNAGADPDVANDLGVSARDLAHRIANYPSVAHLFPPLP